MHRRSFIQKASISTLGMAAAFSLPAYAQSPRLKVGLIGCGWYGMVVSKAALSVGGVELIAVCDVDSEHLKASADELEKIQGKRPKEFKSYEDLLDVKGLQVVFIGSPPHWHALHFIAACKRGLDIYCEKPLAYDVREGQAMVRAAREAGNIVQIGFQRRQSNSYRQAKTLIADGRIGSVHQIGAQIHYNPVLSDHTIQDPPESLDWEAWCGPAPRLEYRPSIGHKAWRLEKEYGNGHLVDWGIHHIDIIRTIMGFGMPASFDTKGGIVELEGKITTPDTLHAIMEFENCPVMWQHRLWGPGHMDPQFNNGVFFYGDKGNLFAGDNKLILMPAGKNQQQEVLAVANNKVQEEHMSDFLKAVQSRDQSLISCPVEDAFQSTATVQLAMASYYTNSQVKWDANKLEITDNPEAARLLARPYRGSYQRPEI